MFCICYVVCPLVWYGTGEAPVASGTSGVLVLFCDYFIMECGRCWGRFRGRFLGEIRALNLTKIKGGILGQKHTQKHRQQCVI